jgi:hypothetical protein
MIFFFFFLNKSRYRTLTFFLSLLSKLKIIITKLDGVLHYGFHGLESNLRQCSEGRLITAIPRTPFQFPSHSFLKLLLSLFLVGLRVQPEFRVFLFNKLSGVEKEKMLAAVVERLVITIDCILQRRPW